jgi:hypothetical protein
MRRIVAGIDSNVVIFPGGNFRVIPVLADKTPISAAGTAAIGGMWNNVLKLQTVQSNSAILPSHSRPFRIKVFVLQV